MTAEELRAHRQVFTAAMRRCLQEANCSDLYEAGFPAYCHTNPLPALVFWTRVRVVAEHIRKLPSIRRALDFGCGGGVMLPILARKAQTVIGYDVSGAPFTLVSRYVRFPGNVEFLLGATDKVPSFGPGEFDLILALDVLEHVADLNETIRALLDALSPRGCIVVSGPTEGWLYRLGRRLAGRDYSGDYHLRGIGTILARFSQLARVANVPSPPWLGLFFRISEARKRPAVRNA